MFGPSFMLRSKRHAEGAHFVPDLAHLCHGLIALAPLGATHDVQVQWLEGFGEAFSCLARDIKPPTWRRWSFNINAEDNFVHIGYMSEGTADYARSWGVTVETAVMWSIMLLGGATDKVARRFLTSKTGEGFIFPAVEDPTGLRGRNQEFGVIDAAGFAAHLNIFDDFGT